MRAAQRPDVDRLHASASSIAAVDFGDVERLAADLVDRLGIDQELVAQHGLELAGVHFRHDDPVEALQQVAQICGHRPDVADVDVGDVGPAAIGAAHRLVDRAVGRAPADHRQLAARAAEADVLVGDRVRDAGDLVRADAGHFGMGLGRIVDVAGAGCLLDPADAVLRPGVPGLIHGRASSSLRA